MIVHSVKLGEATVAQFMSNQCLNTEINTEYRIKILPIYFSH